MPLPRASASSLLLSVSCVIVPRPCLPPDSQVQVATGRVVRAAVRLAGCCSNTMQVATHTCILHVENDTLDARYLDRRNGMHDGMVL
jgi:hypothetical protein